MTPILSTENNTYRILLFEKISKTYDLPIRKMDSRALILWVPKRAGR